jgi:hypothetical protein
LPVPHNEQLPVPTATLYLPISHAKQETPLEPGLFFGQYPALQMQFCRAPLEEGAYEFMGQG